MYTPKGRRTTCLICGKAISAPDYRDVPIYCEEHRAYADKDNKILDEAPMELLFSLITGIFWRAREDYLIDVDGQREDAEIFLRSSWAQDLSLAGFDVEELFESLNEEMADETRRTEK